MSRELIKPTSEEAEKWERIYLAYGAQLYAYAIKTMGNQQDAEDALQATFLKISQNLHRISLVDDSRTFNYIYTILQNYMRDQYRRRSRWREESLETRELAGDSPGPEQEVDEIVLQKLRFEEVAAYVAQMDEKYRLPFVLKYYNHFTEDEIAATLDLPKGAIAVRIFALKRKFRITFCKKKGSRRWHRARQKTRRFTSSWPQPVQKMSGPVWNTAPGRAMCRCVRSSLKPR